MSPMAGNSCTRNYAEVRMRGSDLINGDTMSSESKVTFVACSKILCLDLNRSGTFFDCLESE